MSAKIPLRTDYDAVQARALARKATDPNQVRRLLAIAAVYDGMNRRDAAAVGGMDRQSPARLGVPVQSGRPRGPARPQISRRGSAADGGGEGGVGGDRRGGAGQRRRRALAPARPQGGYPGPLRGGVSRALGLAPAARSRLLAHERPGAPSRPRCGNAGDV